jgi:hypothetical protein
MRPPAPEDSNHLFDSATVRPSTPGVWDPGVARDPVERHDQRRRVRHEVEQIVHSSCQRLTQIEVQGTVTDWHLIFGLVPPQLSMAYTHSSCVPADAFTVSLKPWLSPLP